MSRSPHRAILSAFALALTATGASAQLIPIRTVPLAQADQFDIFPSRSSAMGGVSIALDDAWLDPFVNPAKGARLKAGFVSGAPTLFSLTSGPGGGRTLPLSVLSARRSWFGGLTLAIQEIDGAREILPVFQVSDSRINSVAPAIPRPPVTRSHSNQLAHALIGRPLGDGVSIGASIAWAELNAVDGVELLYPRSIDVSQFGHVVDARVGVLKDWDDGRSVEAMLLHNRTDMAHDVTYADLFWDPDRQQIVQRDRIEHNADRTATWGMHAEYEQPLPLMGWRAGARLTANVATHPKIPNYELMNIPRDPGRSHAYNLGVGVSRELDGTTFAVDGIFEPIRSHTWADASGPIETASGDTLLAGARTIENWFRFSNAVIRVGMMGEGDLLDSETSVAFQLGVSVRSVSYRLRQMDHVQRTERSQRERWTEWMPTLGFRVEMPRLVVAYRGSVTNGTGRPSVNAGGPRLDAALGQSSILVAPSGPITVVDAGVVSHQLLVSLPIR